MIDEKYIIIHPSHVQEVIVRGGMKTECLVYYVGFPDGELIGQSMISLDKKWIFPTTEVAKRWYEVRFVEPDDYIFIDHAGRTTGIIKAVIDAVDFILLERHLLGS